MSRSLLGLATKAQRPNLHYPISDPANGRVFVPPEDTGWRYAQDRMQKLIQSGCMLSRRSARYGCDEDCDDAQ